MSRLVLFLAAVIMACFAAPNERPRRHNVDVGLGGGYGAGGGVGGGYGGYGPVGRGHGGVGYGGHTLPVASQSFSKSSASSSSISTGGSISG